MTTCPVCNNQLDDSATSCPACGYRLQDSTEEFHVLSVEDTSAPAEPPRQSSMPTLCVLNGIKEGMVYPLEGESAVIGRSPKCTVFLNDMTVSREHALLEHVGEGWSIKDTDSFNGVWVNNVNVDHVMLSDRDVIQIGSFILRYCQ